MLARSILSLWRKLPEVLPLNDDCDPADVLDLTIDFHGREERILAGFPADPNDTVTFKWRNATISARAWQMRKFLEKGTQEQTQGRWS